MLLGHHWGEIIASDRHFFTNQLIGYHESNTLKTLCHCGGNLKGIFKWEKGNVPLKLT